MTQKRDLSVYVLRGQPFCNHHLDTVHYGLEIADHLLIFIGSANMPRTPKNPFTANERERLISSCLTEEQLSRVSFVHKENSLYDDPQWIAGVEYNVREALSRLKGPGSFSIVLTGCKSDDTSWYLDKFPHWDKDLLPIKLCDKGHAVHATDVRNALFCNSDWVFDEVVPFHTPAPVTEWLREFRKTETYKDLCEEFRKLAEDRETYGDGPFLTADAVVTQSSNVLLILRKENPGKGLLALPGGFLEKGERFIEGMFRELKEETSLDVPPAIIFNSIKKKEVFDHPQRSLRGHVITQAFLVELKEPHGILPNVKARSDAKEAKWVPYAEILHLRSQMFDDHFDIIRHMLGGLT